jgi:thiamine-phosphate pyrophosphorylase
MKGLLFISHQTDKYDYLQSIDIALQGGCRQIQLRMKEASSDEVEKVGRQAKRMCDQYNARLFIDDHVNVCHNIAAAGVHLGKLDMSPSKAREILGGNFLIGGTANTIEDIIQLKAEGVDYIGLGPFRFTTTKKNLSPILGLEGYCQIVRQCKEYQIDLPIIAIGGITISDIPDILNTGVACIALSSTILSADNPVEETKRIISVINKI